MELYATRWTTRVSFNAMKQARRLARSQSRDFHAQIAHVTVSGLLSIFLASGRRTEAYESLGRLFAGMVAELRKKNVAERLWALFEALPQAVLSAVADSGPKVSPSFNVGPNRPASKTGLRDPSWAVHGKVSIPLPKSPKWNREKRGNLTSHKSVRI